MSKNKVTAILFGFMGCLVLTIIILVIRLSLRPDAPVDDVVKEEPETIIQEGSVEPTPEVIEPEEPQTQIVVNQYVRAQDADTNVNVRSEASTSGRALGKLTYESACAYIEEANSEWTKIDYNGTEAYVYTAYIEIYEVEEEVPVESTTDTDLTDPDATEPGTTEPDGTEPDAGAAE